MTRTGTTSLLAILVAVSSAAWDLSSTGQAAPAPFPWASAAMAVLPHAAAVVAAILVLRGSTWWRHAGLAYLAAFTALESVGLVQIVPFASQFGTGMLWWSVATSGLSLVTAVLIVVVLRDVRATEDSTVPGPVRGAVVAAGLLLVTASTLAWTVTPHARAGHWTFTLGHASPGVLVGTSIGMAVLVGITAVVALSSERSLVVGATAGLLASRPLAVSLFVDRTWQDADAMLAAGWWLALIAQVLLVVTLAGLAARATQVRGPRS